MGNGRSSAQTLPAELHLTILRQSGADLGMLCLLIGRYVWLAFLRVLGNSIMLPQPASQVDEPTARAAEGKVRPGGLIRADHFGVAHRTTLADHRKLMSWIWSYPWILRACCSLPCCPCRLY